MPLDQSCANFNIKLYGSLIAFDNSRTFLSLLRSRNSSPFSLLDHGDISSVGVIMVICVFSVSVSDSIEESNKILLVPNSLIWKSIVGLSLAVAITASLNPSNLSGLTLAARTKLLT